MCLVLEEIISVLAMVHVLWLLHRIENGWGDGSDVRDRNSLIQIASFTVLGPVWIPGFDLFPGRSFRLRLIKADSHGFAGRGHNVSQAPIASDNLSNPRSFCMNYGTDKCHPAS